MTTTWTKEKRRELSNKKKKYYKKHPEKHPNFILAGKNKLTYPERLAYNFFKENNLQFEIGKNISIYWPDFLNEEQKLIVEIDGERWHSSPEQKERDNKRDTFLMSLGYKIIRFPAKNILQNLQNVFTNTDISKIDVNEVKKQIIVIPKKIKPDRFCCDCNIKLKWSKSKRCPSCANKIRKKTNKQKKFMISKEELEKLIQEYPMTKIGKMFGVTDNAIKRRAKLLGIILPKRKGDWEKTRINDNIKKLYDEGKIVEQISNMLNVDIEKIKRYIKSLQPKRKINNSVDKQEIIKLYLENKTQREIAKELNCGKTLVYTTIQNYNKQQALG